jgi:hypothetical protein
LIKICKTASSVETTGHGGDEREHSARQGKRSLEKGIALKMGWDGRAQSK